MKRMNIRIFFMICVGLMITSCGDQAFDPLVSQQAEIQSELLSPSAGLSEDEDVVIVAEWKGGKLTLAQIDRFIDPNAITSNPTISSASNFEQLIANQRKTVTETLVGNYLLLLEAHAMNVTLTDAEKEAILHRAKGNFESEAVYTQYLESANQSENEFINVLANIELGKKCVEQKEQEIWESIDTTKKQFYYDKHIAKFTPPHRSFFNRVDIHIKDGRTTDEAKAYAEKIHAEVTDKISAMTALEDKRNVMREYARNESDGFEADYNGGYVTMYHTPDFAEAYSAECMQIAKETAVGNLSPVYRSKHGYGFLLTKEQHKSYVHPFDSETIQKMLPNMIMEEEMLNWRDELKEKYELNIYEEQFDKEFIEISTTQTANASTQ